MIHLKKDERPREAVYFDKYNNHYASNDSICKLCIDSDKNAIDKKSLFVEFMGRLNGLSGLYLTIFMTICLDFNGVCDTPYRLGKYVIDKYKLNCTIQNIMKYITVLETAGMVHIRSHMIRVDKKYFSEDLSNIDYLVIELNPNITSAPIVV